MLHSKRAVTHYIDNNVQSPALVRSPVVACAWLERGSRKGSGQDENRLRNHKAGSPRTARLRLNDMVLHTGPAREVRHSFFTRTRFTRPVRTRAERAAAAPERVPPQAVSMSCLGCLQTGVVRRMQDKAITHLGNIPRAVGVYNSLMGIHRSFRTRSPWKYPRAVLTTPPNSQSLE